MKLGLLAAALGLVMLSGCSGSGDANTQAKFARSEGKSRCTIELDIAGMT
jgi:hypothetical protein